MSTHKITTADCTWADIHFADISEARQHLDHLIEVRHLLQSLKDARVTISEGRPSTDQIVADQERIDRAIRDCQQEEADLQQLIADCAMDDLFDLV